MGSGEGSWEKGTKGGKEDGDGVLSSVERISRMGKDMGTRIQFTGCKGMY